MPRIVQLTDLHLCRDRRERLKGVPTWETFREVCDHVRSPRGALGFAGAFRRSGPR